MTAKLPFTQAAITRLIKGIEDAGRFVVGARPDGTLIVGDKPFETASLVPVELEQSPDAPVRRFGERSYGGHNDG